jgi:hypothetical protein
LLLLCGRRLLLLLEGLEHLLLLERDPLLPALLGLLDLVPPGLGLVRQHLGPRLLGLLLVDKLHEHALVLEHVALGLEVQLVAEMAVNLLRLAIAAQQATKDAHSLHPEELLRHSGILGTFPLSHASVPALPPRLCILPHAGPGVHSNGLLDDEAVLDKLADILPRVGVGDLVDLIGVEPDLVFAALHDRSGQPLLQLEGTHGAGLDEDGNQLCFSKRFETNNNRTYESVLPARLSVEGFSEVEF